jgi:hypothetical protein
VRSQPARAAANPVAAWRALPGELRLEHVCCLKFLRTVAHDGTICAGATILQLPARANGRSRAGQRPQLQLRLDCQLVVWDGERELVNRPAPADPAQRGALHVARPELGTAAPTAATATSPSKHPWQELTPGSKLQQRRRREGLTKSRTS